MMQTINILLVEDNSGDIMLTQEALDESGVKSNLTVVKDGYEAVNFLEKKGNYNDVVLPDFILLDINLPKMNGHEVLQKVKSNDQLKHIPVIMLTTSTSEQDILKSYQNYANCYIPKPLDVKDFIKVIDSVKTFWGSVAQLPKDIA